MGNGVDLGAAGADGCRSRAGYWQRRKDIWSRCIAGKEISLESSLVKLRESRIYWGIKKLVIEEAGRAGFVFVNTYDFVKPDNVDYFLVFRPQ